MKRKEWIALLEIKGLMSIYTGRLGDVYRRGGIDMLIYRIGLIDLVGTDIRIDYDSDRLCVYRNRDLLIQYSVNLNLKTGSTFQVL